jgi:hypothetical protein
MRGAEHCRSHRDHELGPRGAGAPKGNLNALKTGEYATMPTFPALGKLGLAIARDPEHLPEQIAQAQPSGQLTLEIHGRSGDPIKTLEILRRIFPNLIPHIADSIFLVELERYLPKLPEEYRAGFLNVLYKTALPLSPEYRVRLLREIVGKISKAQFPEEQLTGDD